MEIRRPHASEQDVVQRLVQAVVDETYGGQWQEPPLSIDVEDWTQGWAAVLEGRIVGIALTANDWLEDLWLAADARGRGVGAVLLEHAERDIAARGHAIATLRVIAGNRRAQAFYVRHGWQRSRQYRHEKLPTDVVEFTKRVG
jgi:GNAT superfamily N-acetyltransferase